MKDISYSIINDYLYGDTVLRIIPSSNAKLKDDVFILQLFTSQHENKQMYISKKDIGTIVKALKEI